MNDLFDKKETFWVEYSSIYWAHFFDAQTGIPPPKGPWIW